MSYCCRFLSSCHFIKYKLELPSLSSWGCQTSVFFHQNHRVFIIMHHHSLQAAHTLDRTTLSCHYLCISLFKLELWLKTVQNPQTDCLFKLVNALELGHYPSLVIIIIIHIPLVHTPLYWTSLLIYIIVYNITFLIWTLFIVHLCKRTVHTLCLLSQLILSTL